MQTVEAPVSISLILVCEKCGRRLGEDKNPSHKLVSKLKKASKEHFDKGAVRAVLTSCMDICPEDRISVAVVPLDEPRAATRFFAVKGDDATECSQKILKEIHKSHTGGGPS